MEKHLRKYFILLIALTGLGYPITVFVVSRLPIILLKNNVPFDEAKNIARIISDYILYFFNFIIALTIYFEMKKYNIRSWPILILTVLMSWAGIILFLIGYSNEINNENE
jgi:hypothetical protein